MPRVPDVILADQVLERSREDLAPGAGRHQERVRAVRLHHPAWLHCELDHLHLPLLLLLRVMLLSDDVFLPSDAPIDQARPQWHVDLPVLLLVHGALHSCW